MSTRRFRTLAAAVVLVVAALLTTACENPTDRHAARVNGSAIDRSSLLDEARIYAGLRGDPYGLAAETPHAFTATGLARVLSERVIDRMVLDAAARYGLEPDPALVSQYDQQLSSPSANGEVPPINDLPPDLRQAFLEARALESQLFAYVRENRWWTDEEADQYAALAADGNLQQVVCVHHILVATEQEASDVLAELEGGASFEQLAEERSTDPGSATSGGDLGCNPEGTFVEAFEAAFEGATAGDVVGPVATDFGYHVIRVDQPLGASSIEDAGADAWVELLRANTKVQVDRRFGTWDASTFSVVPPEGATPRSSGAFTFG